MKVNFLIVLALLVAGSQVSKADSVTYTGSSGSLKAQAVFTVNAGTLTITLSNLASAQATQGTILTAVFFDSTKSIGGTLSSVTLGAGSSVVADSGGGTNTGLFGWSTSANPPTAATYAASSSGLNINYTNPLVFLTGPGAGISSAPPNSPDGPPGGLIGSGGINTLNFAYINNTVVYTISGVSITSASNINDVSFQYGTALNCPNIPGNRVPNNVPAPLPAPVYAGLALLGMMGLKLKLGRGSQDC